MKLLKAAVAALSIAGLAAPSPFGGWSLIQDHLSLRLRPAQGGLFSLGPAANIGSRD